MNLFNLGAKAKADAPVGDSTTKKCKYCKEEILKDAKVCKHCGKNQPVEVSKKAVLIICALVFLPVIIAGLGSGGSMTSQPDNSNVTSSSDRKAMSIVFAKHTVENLLKSPSTAKFSNVNAYELSNMKDVWAVNGYVDSQNSFGAMIRSIWEVQLDYRDGKGGTVKSVIFDGKQVL